MTRIERTVPVTANQIFAVLKDGWSYAAWVVGNSHVRDVDRQWPAVGSRLHHSSGLWPFQVSDVTVVRAVEPDRSLVLEARLWLFGRLRIEITLAPGDSSDPESTTVAIEETVVGGPARLVPHQLQKALFLPRNAEALARLADLASGRGATLR